MKLGLEVLLTILTRLFLIKIGAMIMDYRSIRFTRSDLKLLMSQVISGLILRMLTPDYSRYRSENCIRKQDASRFFLILMTSYVEQ
jgi:hypothetical protein